MNTSIINEDNTVSGALSEVSNDSSEDILSKKVRFEEEESLWNEAFAVRENDQTVAPLDEEFPPLGTINLSKNTVNAMTDDRLVKEQFKPASSSAGKKSS